MLKSLQAWLGFSEEAPASEPAPLRELLDALDHLDPARAQFLARFAFLLGRVARVDDTFSDEEGMTEATWILGPGAGAQKLRAAANDAVFVDFTATAVAP